MAWTPLGWEPAAFSEIEPFPCSVLQHHYPHVPNLGDVTKITRQQVEALGRIDLVCGGFPCQDLSVAGKRKGLMNADGNPTRSGLFFDAMRIAEWTRARWTVLENVPGLFSSNGGRDFAAVVGEMAGCEFDVPPGGWENAGVAVGPLGLVEWVTLDAQYVRVESHPRAVPQRRRRVFIVRDSGDWANRPPLFLERESLRGHPAPRREAGQGAAGTIGGGPDGGRISGAVTSKWAKGSGGPAGDETYNMVAHTLRGSGFDASEDGTGRRTPLVPMLASTLNAAMGKGKNGQDVGALVPAIVGQAMSSKWAKGTAGPAGPAGPAGDKHHNLIPVPIAFPERMSGTQCASSENVSPALGALNPMAAAIQDVRGTDKAQNGRGWNDDGTAYTLDTHATQGVAYSDREALYDKGFIALKEGNASTQETYPGTLLRTLLQEVGEEAFAKWGLGILDSLQSPEILRQALHGFSIRPAAFSRSWVVYCALSRQEDGSGWLLQSLREAECERCSSPGWEPPEQLARELGAYLSELSRPGAQAARLLHDLWQASQGIGVLRQALSAVQEVGRSAGGQGQSILGSSEGRGEESYENVLSSGMQCEVSRERVLHETCAAGEARDSREGTAEQERSGKGWVGETPFAIRRLTVEECEFLQGFPRGYSKIPWRKKPASECPDGPRYKSLGNSWAVNVAAWVGRRIMDVEEACSLARPVD